MIEFHCEEKNKKRFRNYVDEINSVANWRISQKWKCIDADKGDLAIIIFKEDQIRDVKYRIKIRSHGIQKNLLEEVYGMPDQEAIILEMIYESVQKRETRDKLVEEYKIDKRKKIHPNYPTNPDNRNWRKYLIS